MTVSAALAAAVLGAARRGETPPLADLPPALRPRDEAAAYAIQQAAMADRPIGGWKVGAAGADVPCQCAPLPEAGIARSSAQLPQGRLRGVEAEVAFRLGRDLPARDVPYTAADVADALVTAHPAIEVLESAFAEPDAADKLSNLADSLMHGGFIYGPGQAAWQAIDFPATTVTQTIDGATVSRTGNPAGDMLRLVVWLANEGSRWAGGLQVGQFVTCGSWTGKTWAPVGARVRVSFPGLGEAEVEFAA